MPVEELYRCCRSPEKLMAGGHGVGRIIARPFIGNRAAIPEPPTVTIFPWSRLETPCWTDRGPAGAFRAFRGKDRGYLRSAGGYRGLPDQKQRRRDRTGNRADPEGFQRPVLCKPGGDFDMVYGHRNDAEGYARALSYFDSRLPRILAGLGEDDLLMITADHGCDPSTPSTDHSRGCVPGCRRRQGAPGAKTWEPCPPSRISPLPF